MIKFKLYEPTFRKKHLDSVVVRSHPEVVEEPDIVLSVLGDPGPDGGHPGLLVFHPE